MTGVTSRAWTFLGRIVGRARSARITFSAAAISYYAFLSAIPLSVFGMAVVVDVAGPGTLRELSTLVGWSIPATTRETLRTRLPEVAESTPLTATGILVLAWSALRLLRGVDAAFARAYDGDVEKSIAGRLWDHAVVAVAVVGGVALTVAVSVSLAAVNVPREDLVGGVVLVAGLATVFVPLYYVLPDVDLGLHEAVPGAVLAAVLWAGLQVGFRRYLRFAGDSVVYGVFGGLILLMTWIYLGALALLIGAVSNAVLAGEA